MKLSSDLVATLGDYVAGKVQLPVEAELIDSLSDVLFWKYSDCNVLYANAFLDLTDIQNVGEADVHVVVFLPSSEECGSDRYYKFIDTEGEPA